jgi:hypothetical protein
MISHFSNIIELGGEREGGKERDGFMEFFGRDVFVGIS